jgi:hypothetical protein
VAKGEAKKTNAMMDSERARQQSEHSAYTNQMSPERNAEKERYDAEHKDVYDRYSKFAGDEMYQSPLSAAGSGGGGGGAGSAIQNRLTSGHMNLAGGLDEAKNNFSGLASTGGDWDPRIRDTYGSFAQNGGYNDSDIANIRSRATSGIPAFYQTLQDDMSRKAAARGQGNNSVGYQAGLARMARDQSRGVASADLDAEVGIKDKQNSGRLQGASGLFGLDSAANQNRLTANSNLADIGKFGYQGLESDAAAERANAAAGAASAQAAWNRQNDIWDRQMSATDRMGGLESETDANLGRYDSNALGERGMVSNDIGSGLGLRASYNPNRSVMDNIGQGVGIASRIGGLAAGGLGAFVGGGGGGNAPNVGNPYNTKNLMPGNRRY